MKIQLALDRLTIDEAMELGEKVRDEVDWIEVGTSLIKEFGIESIRRISRAFPDKEIVADVKTNDNAVYEFNMCYEAGAAIATVMGTAPIATIETCVKTADQHGKKVMIDLLNTSEEQVRQLMAFDSAIFCIHVSKDLQEVSGQTSEALKVPEGLLGGGYALAAAGGIAPEAIEGLRKMGVNVAIVGSAITKAEDPAAAAQQLRKEMEPGE